MSSFSDGLRTVQQLLGTKYVWGGNGQGGVDCSGFTRAVYAAMGIDLPRVSYQQANAGQKIGRAQAQPGDLVSWDLNGRNPGADHVGIYMGDGKVAEASSSQGKVVIRNLWGNAQFTRFGGVDDRGAQMASQGGAMGAPGGPTDYAIDPGALDTTDTTRIFGSMGAELDDQDNDLLKELWSFADINDPGEAEDTVGPYNVARLSWDRENGTGATLVDQPLAPPPVQKGVGTRFDKFRFNRAERMR